MSRKWILALTYEPKIAGVLDGSITQTIRIGYKYSVGDFVSLHSWEGRPYRTKWSNQTPYFELTHVSTVWLSNEGIALIETPHNVRPWEDCADLAKRDGIVPPTGEALKEVLLGGHPIRKGGLKEAQIIRWDYNKRLTGGDPHDD